MVKCSLGCTVIRTPRHWKQCKPGSGVDEARLVVLLLQERNERCRQMHVGEIVGTEFEFEYVKIDGIRLGKVKATLNTGVEENRVKVGVLLCDILNKLGDLGELCDVESLGRDLVLAVLVGELIKLFLSSSDNNNVLAILYNLFGQSPANAGGGTKNKNFVVFERHVSLGAVCMI